MPSRRTRFTQSGFSLIEVLVSVSILLIGVLGVVAMVDGANAVSSQTKARVSATSVARSIVEVGRAVQYRSLTTNALLAALQARPALADSRPQAGHTVASAGFFYDVLLQVCSIDDPKDGLGLADGTVEFCPESEHAASSLSATDRNPDDYRRIATTLAWEHGGGSETVKQTSIVSNPVGGLGPTVIRLDAASVTGTPKTVTNPDMTVVPFDAETSSNAEDVEWSVNGDPRDKADQVGASLRNWTFTWDIAGTTGGPYYHDCTYVVTAEAFDDAGRAGSPRSLTIVLNRNLPTDPDSVEGGRNGNGARVDLEWEPNPECDVLGYRVSRTTGDPVTGPWTQVTCRGQTGSYHLETSCLDEDAPAGGPLRYRVIAVDTPPDGGAPRPGDASTPLLVAEDTSVPGAPTGVSACLGGTPDCNEPDGTPAADGVTVIRWDAPAAGDVYFYRLYRDGTTYADRVAAFFPEGGDALAWTDPDSPDGSHSYRVSAVNASFGESFLSDPVTFP
jgi:prepilin-type N-terminal cleavage/methylation domain-containing protein